MAFVRLLFLGDVFGEPGLRALEVGLRDWVSELGADLVVVNGENSADGVGITQGCVRRMRAAGVGAITTGNHVWSRREFLGQIGTLGDVVRPANYPAGAPGRGWCLVSAAGVPVAVVNLAGRLFMDLMDCPFQRVDEILAEVGGRAPIVLVDFHAEATSEKRAMGWHLNGRVTAVLGTHTHVATADAQVLDGGTGYITDVGMSGVLDSVIGVPKGKAVERFVARIPHRAGVASGPGVLCGVLIEADAATGRCRSILQVSRGP